MLKHSVAAWCVDYGRNLMSSQPLDGDRVIFAQETGSYPSIGKFACPHWQAESSRRIHIKREANTQP